MSHLRSCGSLAAGNDGLLKTKAEPESKDDRDQRIKDLEMKKQERGQMIAW